MAGKRGAPGGSLTPHLGLLGRSVIPDPGQRLSLQTPRGRDRNPLWASQCEVSPPPSKSSCPARVGHMPPPPLGSYQSPLMPSESFSVEFPQSSLLDACFSSQLSAPDHGPALMAPCPGQSSQPQGPQIRRVLPALWARRTQERVSEIKGRASPKDLSPQAPVPPMCLPGKGYMCLRELIGLAVLISSPETRIQRPYTCTKCSSQGLLLQDASELASRAALGR